jgi:uncharacterized protein (DUF2252 family)
MVRDMNTTDSDWLSPAERRKLGQSRRKQMGRQTNNELKAKARPTDALKLLERAAKGRVPKLVALKFQLMAVSPFGYFRGAVPVMAADLAALPNTGIITQLCGDAHVRNLGAFAAPDGRLVFDINDFDETIRGPFEWDLKRMAASLVLAGRESGQKDSSSRAAVVACIARYATMMRSFAEMPILEVARHQVHVEGAAVQDALLKAERATPLHTLEQLTELVDKKATQREAPRRFKTIPPMLTRVKGKEAQEAIESLKPYRKMLEPQRVHLLSLYRPVDVAFKVVGTGSVGLRDYCIYLEGNGPGDPLFLQIKEETESGYAAYLPGAKPARQNGQRVVEGQKAMQVQSDPFLGWTEMDGRHYLVRQLNDHKGSVDMNDFAGKGLTAYAQVCGELLARGHARSGDALSIAGYVGAGDGFAEALAEFGARYADRTEKDWEELKRSGKGRSTKTGSAGKKQLSKK